MFCHGSTFHFRLPYVSLTKKKKKVAQFTPISLVFQQKLSVFDNEAVILISHIKKKVMKCTNR